MNTVMFAMSLLLASAMIGSAYVALQGKSMAVAVLGAGAVSLFASVMFVLLAAPDVAMTEAAIGSGLTTFLFFFVMGRVRGGKEDD